MIIFWRNIFLIQVKKNGKFDFRSGSDQDPDPLFHETDPRIRIKMKQIGNTGCWCTRIFLRRSFFFNSYLTTEKFNFIFMYIISVVFGHDEHVDALNQYLNSVP